MWLAKNLQFRYSLVLQLIENNMPQNCQAVSIEEVVNFFENKIDGMGKNDDHPRNPGLSYFIRQWNNAELCELSENEFKRLIVQDEPHIHLENKHLKDLSETSLSMMEEYSKQLEKGKKIPPLIVREPATEDIKESSFYMEDGTHRALAYKKYLLNSSYEPVKAYVGNREI